MIADYKIFNDANVISQKKLVIWGAGINGRRMAQALKKYIKEIEFVDVDKEKAGKQVDRISVALPEKLLEYQADGREYAIAMSTNSPQIQESILQQTEGLHIKETDIFTWYAMQAALFAMKQTENEPVLSSDEYAGQAGIEKCSNEVALMERRQTLLGEMFFASATDEAVWVYQDKKVGSCTIVSSAKAVGIFAVHVHSFDTLKHERFEFGNAFIKKIIQRTSGKVISLVREPIARQISLLWHYFGNDPSGFLKECHSWKEREELFYAIPNKEDEFEWYVQEFQRVLDINVYEHPFDREAGYTIINQDGISVLLLKMEKIDDLEEVIGDFLGEKEFKILRDNVGKEKGYKYAYQNYLDHVMIPRGFYDHYYKENPYMDHFYTEEEKAAFSLRWKTHICES